MFTNQAWAQAAGGSGGGGLDSLSGMLPLVLVFVVMYFLMLRPQQQKAKRHKELVKNLRRGDRVLTQGGMLGTVAKVVSDGEVQIEIAEGVKIRVMRDAVQQVLAKTEPASGGAKDEDGDATSGDSSSVPAAPAAPAPVGIAGLLSRLLGGGK